MNLISRLVKVKMYIDDHFDDQLDLSLLCDEACISKYHFLRLFKKTYKITPYQYLLLRRLEKVKYELTHTNQPICEICYQSGFNGVGTFNNLFKKMTGDSPQSYRKKTQRKKQLAYSEPGRFIPHCMATMWMHKK